MPGKKDVDKLPNTIQYLDSKKRITGTPKRRGVYSEKPKEAVLEQKENEKKVPQIIRKYTYKGEEVVKTTLTALPNGASFHVQSLKGDSNSKIWSKIGKKIADDTSFFISTIYSNPVLEGKKPVLNVSSDNDSLLRGIESEFETLKKKGASKISKHTKKKSEKEYLEAELYKQENAWKRGVVYAAGGFAVGLIGRFGIPYVIDFFNGGYKEVVDALSKIGVDLNPAVVSLQTVGAEIGEIVSDVQGYVDVAKTGLSSAFSNVGLIGNNILDALENSSVIGTAVGTLRGYASEVGGFLGNVKDSVLEIRNELQNITSYTASVRADADGLEAKGNQAITDANTPRTVDYGGDVVMSPDLNSNDIVDSVEAGTQGNAEWIYDQVELGNLTDDYSILIHDDWLHRCQLMLSGQQDIAYAQSLRTLVDNIDGSVNTINASALAIYNSQAGTGYVSDIEGKLVQMGTSIDGIDLQNTQLSGVLSDAQTNVGNLTTSLNTIDSNFKDIDSKLIDLQTKKAEMLGYVNTINTEAGNIPTSVDNAKKIVYATSKVAGTIAVYSVIGSTLGVFALPIITGISGYRTTKKINNAVKKRGNKPILSPELVTSKTEINYSKVA